MKNPVKFGKYYLLERISVGGMAEVFKAKAFGEAGFERLVAVKRILPSIAEDQEFIAMFVDEAKLAVQLTHPNIAQIFELGKVGEAYFIALEYVGGKDMRAIFERSKKRSETLPIPMACYMVMKLCEGLDYAHNKKDSAGRSLELVHRNVSPQNIIVSFDGDVKLIDFGIAKAASKSSKTQAGILKGKFGYMSPEQVRGLQVDRRSDIFAVGICLYELLTTERLFVGESDFSTLEKVRNVEITPPTAYNKKVPEELENIVLKALAKHPEDRYRSAMDLHDDLQSFMYTSGNFFARKDLSGTMHRLFEEEIRKEQSRDDEFRKFDSRRAAEANVFENMPATSTPPPPAPAPAAAPVRSSGPPVPGSPTRSAPPSAPAPRPSNPAGRVASAIPAPPGRPQPVSRPPGAAPMMASAGGGNAVTVARQPTAAMPVHVAISAPAVAAEMDLGWSDDESATQIMDKPAEMANALQSAQRPAARAGHAPGASAPISGVPRVTGSLPALPALPGRPPSTTALGIAPPPATSLQQVAAGAAAAAPARHSAPAVAAPMVAAPAVSLAPATSSSAPPPPPGNFGNLAPGFGPPPGQMRTDAPQRTNGASVKADWPANHPPAAAATTPRKKDTKSTALLAFFGVIAVAAIVVLALQLTGSPPTGALIINTTDGAEVTVDGQPVIGSGTRFEVSGLPAGRPHHISVRKTGFETLEQDYTVIEGNNALMLALQPSAPIPQVVPPPPIDQQLNPTPGSVAMLNPPLPGQPGVIPPQVPVQQLAPPPVPPVPAPQPAVAPAHSGHTHGNAPSQPRPPRQQPDRNNGIRATTPVERPIPPPTPPSGGGDDGTLLLSTMPAATCTIAGHGSHSGPWRLTLPAGRHSVSCRNAELSSSSNFSVTITAGQTTRMINHPLE